MQRSSRYDPSSTHCSQDPAFYRAACHLSSDPDHAARSYAASKTGELGSTPIPMAHLERLKLHTQMDGVGVMSVQRLPTSNTYNVGAAACLAESHVSSRRHLPTSPKHLTASSEGHRRNGPGCRRVAGQVSLALYARHVMSRYKRYKTTRIPPRFFCPSSLWTLCKNRNFALKLGVA